MLKGVFVVMFVIGEVGVVNVVLFVVLILFGNLVDYVNWFVVFCVC